MFIVIGNYLPKIKQNGTLGIRGSWTLGSEKNWNKTHRLGGKVWAIGGRTLVIGMKHADETRALYQDTLGRIGRGKEKIQ